MPSWLARSNNLLTLSTLELCGMSRAIGMEL